MIRRISPWAGVVTIVGFALLNKPVRAQQPGPPARPEFVVATIKTPAPPEGDAIFINALGTFRHGKLEFGNASLSDLLKFAYNIGSDSLLVGPDWVTSKSVRYDVVALADPATPRDQLALMLQTLLADRLKLVVHHDRKELRFLALVPGKNKAKLLPAQPDPPPETTYNSAGRIARNQLSMPQLALLLSRFERETVIDRTGLKGSYEVKLEWTPEYSRVVESAENTTRPSLSTAVQEQLGLKLEAHKGPLEVLVVDNAEKVPVDN